MLGRLYEGEACSAARALEVVGERWTLLIVRDAMFAGSRRFADFQHGLGIAPNVLTTRLRDLVDNGIMARADNAEYLLTDKGMALQPALLALTAWGDTWARSQQGRPVVYRHHGCSGEVNDTVICATCGSEPEPSEVEAEVADWAIAVKRPTKARGVSQ